MITPDMLDFEKLLHEVHVHFARSGGKGGQNVNKVETKVELTFNIASSQVLDEETKALLLKKLAPKLDHHGNVHSVSSSERYQHANRKKAEEKLLALLKRALMPEKPRFATTPSKKVKQARLESKRQHGQKKKSRKIVSLE